MDWKVLIGVIVLAAIGGWLLTRERSAPERRGPASVRHEGAIRASPPPARPAAPPIHPAAPVGDDGGARDVDRALADLASALEEDQSIERSIFPQWIRGARIPVTAPYTRAPRFWQPGLTRGVMR